MTFKELEIIEPILRAIEDEEYTHPTPIQEQAIPILLRGKDLLGCAQTGTGKTAAFAIPILQHIYNKVSPKKGKRRIKALVVTPTRELALQIGDSFSAYGKYTGIKNTVIFGGVKQGAQTDALQRGVDVLVATPGRLLDLIDQGFISLNDIEYFVLDEADHMLDMGFIQDIRKIIKKLPPERQSLFFSATMPVDIIELSQRILGNPESVTIKPEQATAEKVEQSVYFVSKKSKPKLLVHLLKEQETESVLIFSRTKYGADRIVKTLNKAELKAVAIHGDKSQNARQRALNDFKEGEVKILVATDIAARGIDVSGLALVVNFDLPNIPETYVHRIGRTGRAKASGSAISFCDADEKPYLLDIQKLIDLFIPVVKDHPFPMEAGEEIPKRPEKQKKQQQRPRSGRPQPQSARKRSGGANNNSRSGNNNRKGGKSTWKKSKSSNSKKRY